MDRHLTNSNLSEFFVSKRILITGSSGSIGSEIADSFFRKGFSVFGIDKTEARNLSFQFIGNLENDKDFENSKKWLRDVSRYFDVLINCVGITRQMENNFDEDNFKANIRVNLEAPFSYCGIAINKAITETRPLSIINVTSLGAHQGFPLNPSYQISKAGLGQLTRSICVDYGKYGIRANNIVPGYIRTSMTEKSFNDTLANQKRAERAALKRWGKTSDLVGAVHFLASEESAFVAGIDLFVDGGWNINGL